MVKEGVNAPATSVADRRPPKPPDLGVLFVHGIGTQPQGETVTGWGDVLIAWLSDWLRHGRGREPSPAPTGIQESGPVRTTRARLRRDEDRALLPHVDVEIDPAVEHGAESTQKWRIAESWWADVFQPPRFRELAFWGFAVLPWALVAHFITRLQRAWRRIGRPSERAAWSRLSLLAVGLLWELLLVILAILMSPLLAGLVLVMLLLAAAPFRTLREAAAGLQRLMSMTIGDSFVLLGSPSRAAAIVSRVEEDISAMGDCGGLVVVAHSQGAAVAYKALRRADPANLRKFLTFGSGQTKLAALEKLTQTGAHRVVWLAPLALVVLMMAAWYGIERARAGNAESLITLALVGLVAVAILIFGLVKTRDPLTPTTEDLDVGATHGWLDLYASNDPVPNGPLFGIDESDTIFVSQEIVNVASTLQDHSAYWRNQDEFVPEVAMTLGVSAGLSLDRPQDLGPVVRLAAKQRRRWRIRCLKGLRLLALGTAVFLLAGDAERLSRLGRRVIDAGFALIDLVPLVGPTDQGRVGGPVDPWVGALAMATAVALGYALVVGIWRLWERADYRRFVRREPFQLWTPEFVAGLYATATLLALAWRVPTLASPSFDYGWLLLLLFGWILIGLVTLIAFMPLMFLGWLLMRLGVIQPGRFLPSWGLWAAVTAPAYLLALVLEALPGSESVAVVLSILYAPAILGLVAPIVSSSLVVQRLLGPLRRIAAAEPVAITLDRSDRALVTDDALVDAAKTVEVEIRRSVEELSRKAAGRAADLSGTRSNGEVERLIRVPGLSFSDDRKRIAELTEEAEALAAALRRRGRGPAADSLLAVAAPYSATAAIQLWQSVGSGDGSLDVLVGHEREGSFLSRRRVARVRQPDRARFRRGQHSPIA
jgi:hypothetical protein